MTTDKALEYLNAMRLAFQTDGKTHEALREAISTIAAALKRKDEHAINGDDKRRDQDIDTEDQ